MSHKLAQMLRKDSATVGRESGVASTPVKGPTPQEGSPKTVAANVSAEKPKPSKAVGFNDSPEPQRKLDLKEDKINRITDRFMAAQQEQKENEDRRRKEVNRKSWKKINSSIAGRWNDALSAHKDKEAENLEQARGRKKTLGAIQQEYGEGFVKKRIEEWEVLIMMAAASKAQVADIVAWVKEMMAKRKGESGSEDFDTYEDTEEEMTENGGHFFTMGDTHVYSAKTFGKQCAKQIQDAVKQGDGEPIALPCGVYGEDGSEPPISVVAVGMIDPSGAPVVALTIGSLEGGDEFDATAYGLKKVAVCMPEGKGELFERIYDVTPVEGWEKWNKECEALVTMEEEMEAMPSEIVSKMKDKISSAETSEGFMDCASMVPGKQAYPFVLGDIHLYGSQTLGEEVSTKIGKLVKHFKGEPIALRVKATSADGTEPPIVLTAMGMVHGEQGILALTINGLPFMEYEAAAFGIKDVKVTMQNEQFSVLELPFDVTPVQGWEQWEVDCANDAKEKAKIAEIVNMAIEKAADKEDGYEDTETVLTEKNAYAFTIGDIHIYGIKTLGEHSACEVLDAIEANNNQSVSLPCTLVSKDGTEPPLTVAAVGMKDPDGIGIVALTIKGLPFTEFDPAAYGVKDVSISMPDGKEVLLQRAYDVVPRQGYEQWEVDCKADAEEKAAIAAIESRVNALAAGKEDGYEDTEEALTDKDAYAFTIGDIHIYGPMTLGEQSACDVLDAIEANNNQSVSLPCTLISKDGTEPPLTIAAIGMKDPDGIGIVALTIKGLPFTEFDPAAYGVKSLTISMPSGKTTLLERSYDVTPKQGWERWENDCKGKAAETERITAMVKSVHELAAGKADGYDDTVETLTDKNAYAFTVGEVHIYGIKTLGENGACKVLDAIEANNKKAVALTSTVTSEDGSEAPLNVEAVGMHDSDGIGIVAVKISTVAGREDDVEAYGVKTLKVTMPDGKEVLLERSYDVTTVERSQSISKLFNSMLGSEEEDGRVTAYSNDRLYRESQYMGIFNFGSKLTMNADTDCHTVYPALDKDRHSYTDRVDNIRNDAWSLEDERADNLPDTATASISVDVDSVLNVSSAGNCLVMQMPQGAMVTTGTLKSTNTKENHVVCGDYFFEWVRGPAASGWMIKWPMKSQARGRRTRRFFLLRGSQLSYHRGRPNNPAEVANEAPAASLELTFDTQAQKVRYFVYPTIQVKTPNDSLWFMCAKQGESRDKWIEQLGVGVNQLARRQIFHTKGRIETLWHHESSSFNIVATDGCVLPDEMFKSVSLFSADDGSYSVDISVTGHSRFQLELRTVDHSTDLGSTLGCVKICGDEVIVGGSNGFVGVGTSASITEDSDSNVMLCLNPAQVGDLDEVVELSAHVHGEKNVHAGYLQPVKDIAVQKSARNQGLCGHSATATITCIASASNSGFFATGDDQGGICLWKRVPRDVIAQHFAYGSPPPGAILHSFVTVAEMGGLAAGRAECVRSLHFLPGEEHLVVGTNERLLLVVVPMVKGYVPEKDWLADDAAVSPLKTKMVVLPSSGYVISTKRKNGRKVYINVTHHSDVPLRYHGEHSIAYLAPRLTMDGSRDSDSGGIIGTFRRLSGSAKDKENLLWSPLSVVMKDLIMVKTPAQSMFDPDTANTRPAAVSNGFDSDDPPVVPFVSVSEAVDYKDAQGNLCAVYNAVISSNLFSELDPAARKELGSLIVERANSLYADTLEVYGIELVKKASYFGEAPRPDTVIVGLTPAPPAERKDIMFLKKTIPGPASASLSVIQRDFFGWIEVEQVPKGKSAIFSMNVEESEAHGEMSRQVVLWKVARTEVDDKVKDPKACEVTRKLWFQSYMRMAFRRIKKIDPTPMPLEKSLNTKPRAKVVGVADESSEKTSFFGYLFGGGKKASPSPAEKVQVEDTIEEEPQVEVETTKDSIFAANDEDKVDV